MIVSDGVQRLSMQVCVALEPWAKYPGQQECMALRRKSVNLTLPFATLSGLSQMDTVKMVHSIYSRFTNPHAVTCIPSELLDRDILNPKPFTLTSERKIIEIPGEFFTLKPTDSTVPKCLVTFAFSCARVSLIVTMSFPFSVCNVCMLTLADSKSCVPTTVHKQSALLG